MLEILSKSSEQKDNVTLKQRYHEAGIREYWVVDVRKEPLVFDIFRATAKGYVRTAKHQGWVKSVVFGRSFKLEAIAGLQGHPNYNLSVK